MEKLLFSCLIAAAIYFLFLLSRLVFLRWKFSRSSEKEISFLQYAKKDEDLKFLAWLLPLVLVASILNSTFKNNLYYKFIMCFISAVTGIYFIFKAIVSKDKSPASENSEDKKTKWFIIVPVVFLYFLVLIFLSKSSIALLTPIKFLYLLALLLGGYFIGVYFYSRMKSKKINSSGTFYKNLLLFVVILVILFLGRIIE